MRVVNFQPKGRSLVPHLYRVSRIEGLYYELTPGMRFQWTYGATHFFGRGFSVPVEINSLGFRDEEVAMPKPVGVLRILALGDSFTMAMGVPVEQGYAEQLERMLSAEAGRRVEVVNTGVGGYNTAQELAFLDARGLDLEPDMILLGFQVNDVTSQSPLCPDGQGYLRRCDEAPDRGRIHFDATVYREDEPRGLLRTVLEESHLLRWLNGRVSRGQNRILRRSPGSRDRNAAARALLGIRDVAEREGIPLFVAIFPLIEDLPPDDPDVVNLRWIEQLCRWQGIPHRALDRVIAGIPPEELWVHPRDHHPNARAHRLFAEAIQECIMIDERGIEVACLPEAAEVGPPPGFEPRPTIGELLSAPQRGELDAPRPAHTRTHLQEMLRSSDEGRSADGS